MNPTNFYETQCAYYHKQRQSIKKQRNFVTIAKLVTASLLIYGICLWSWEWIIPTLILFAILWRFDDHLIHHIDFTSQQVIACKRELDYLNGDFSKLKEGNNYANVTHPYALDLDIVGKASLFQTINRTTTLQGEQLLANWLLAPEQSHKEITDRQNATQELTLKSKWMIDFLATGALHPTSLQDISYIHAWSQLTIINVPKPLKATTALVNIATLSSWTIAFFGIIPYSVAAMISLLQLGVLFIFLKRINRYHAQLSHFIRAVGNYFELIKSIDKQTFTSEPLHQLREKLLKEGYTLTAFNQLNRLMSSLDQRNNVLITIALNGLYMKDIWHVWRLENWRKKHAVHIPEWIEAVSRFDALLSMALFRFNHPQFTVPRIDETTIVCAKGLAHPLLRSKNKVANNYSVDHLHTFHIVTGANMAGKSTFLRSVGVNLVLAMSGNVVCAEQFTCCTTKLFTSMRTTDNLAEGTSYFHAELLRLKQLTEQAAESTRTFVIMDEMLKGTNSHDKLIGSIGFLRKLLTLRVSGLVATHDLALGKLSSELPQHFTNVCFEIAHKGNEVVYDYKLHSGVSQNMNASILLHQMGLIEKKSS